IRAVVFGGERDVAVAAASSGSAETGCTGHFRQSTAFSAAQVECDGLGGTTLQSVRYIIRKAAAIRLRVRRYDGNGNHRHAAPGAILRGIEAVCWERVGGQCFCLEILSTHPSGIQAARSIACARDQAAVDVEVRSRPATAMSARAKGRGNILPRFSARRRMPRQAVELSQYRCGNSPVSSMSDNEDTAAALGYSEKLSVQNPVGDPIPALDQHPEEGSKRPSSVNGQDTGDVLPHQPSGPDSISKSSKLDGEVAARIIQSRSFTGDGERLARCSSGQKVDCSHIVFTYLCEVARVDDVALGGQSNNVANGRSATPGFLPVRGIIRAGHEDGSRGAVARAQQPAAERVNLGEHRRSPAERLPCDRNRFNAGTD